MACSDYTSDTATSFYDGGLTAALINSADYAGTPRAAISEVAHLRHLGEGPVTRRPGAREALGRRRLD